MFTYSLTAAALTASLFAQAATIPDRVLENHGEPLSIVIHGDSRGISIRELATAPLVVRGKLVQIESHLSNDNRHIWTTYQLLPNRVLIDRTKAHAAPGITEPLVVTLYGGTVPLSGTTATLLDASVRPWTDGADLLLFLVKAADIGAKGWRPMGGASGMFEIEKTEILRSLRSHAPDPQDIEGASFDSVVSAVASTQKSGD